jgi:integrase
MLTDLVVRGLKSGPKPYKKADRDGLYIYVTPSGSKLWRMKFRFDGREQLLSFGDYRQVSLAEARARCQVARQQLRNKVNPAAALSAVAPVAGPPVADRPTFEQLARDWHVKQAPGWRARHADDVLVSLERDVFPAIGRLPIDMITVPIVYALVHAIEEHGAVETAHRVRQRISAVHVFGIAKGVCADNPAAAIKGALTTITKKRRPAIIELDELREMLRKAEAEHCHPVTKLALRLLALTAVRPGELRLAGWREFDLTADSPPVWRIGGERMKMGQAHVVPLAPQAVDVIEAVRVLSGRGPLLFPNSRHAHLPMSENSLGYLLNRAGFHRRHVPHGFRSAFSSIMNERDPADGDVVEVCLAHSISGVRGRYMRADFNGRRRALLAEWADLLLDGFAPAATLLEGPRH